MGRKERRNQEKQQRRQQSINQNQPSRDQVLERIEKQKNQLTYEENLTIEQREAVLKKHEGEYFNMVDGYCKSVDMITDKYIKKLTGKMEESGLKLTEEEKKAMALTASLVKFSANLESETDKVWFRNKCRDLLQIIAANAALRIDHDFFKNIGYIG